MHEIRFSAGAPPRTPLGELTTLPQPPNRLGRGKPPPHSLSPRRLRRLGLVASANWGGGISILQGGWKALQLGASTFSTRPTGYSYIPIRNYTDLKKCQLMSSCSLPSLADVLWLQCDGVRGPHDERFAAGKQ